MREGQNHSAAWAQVGDSGKGWESRGRLLTEPGQGPGETGGGRLPPVAWNDLCAPCQFLPGASISSPVKWGIYLDWREA